MTDKPCFPDRLTTRLPGYNYSLPGAYFITSVTRHRICLFGEISAGSMHLSPFGNLVHRAWLDLAAHFEGVSLDAFCIMPSQLHGILCIHEEPGGSSLPVANSENHHDLPVLNEINPEQTRPYQTISLMEVVWAFKTYSARRINAARSTPGLPVWQRSFHDQLIRDDKDLERIRNYILENPMLWLEDEEAGSIR